MSKQQNKAQAKTQTQAQTQAQQSAQTEVIIETMQAQLEAVESVLNTPLEVIMQLPIKERIEALKQRQNALQVKAKLTPLNENANFSATGLSGSDLIGKEIYVESVNGQISDTLKLYRNVNLKHHILEDASYTRSWNTSLGKYEANKVKNAENVSNKAYKRQVETIPYFDNINAKINGLSGKTTESKRFKYFFEGLLNENGIAGQNLTLYVETSKVPQGANVPFNSYNTILVYNENENDKSLQLFKAWLMFKGASENDLSNEAV